MTKRQANPKALQRGNAMVMLSVRVNVDLVRRLTRYKARTELDTGKKVQVQDLVAAALDEYLRRNA